MTARNGFIVKVFPVAKQLVAPTWFWNFPHLTRSRASVYDVMGMLAGACAGSLLPVGEFVTLQIKKNLGNPGTR